MRESDALNRETTEIDPLGYPSTIAYDADGNQTQTIDQLSQPIDYVYNADNELTQETWYSAGGTALNTQTFSYDGDGNELTAGDQNGTYTMTYNALNQMTSQTDIWGLTLTFSYDKVGNQTQVKDSLGGTTTSVYDAANQQTTLEFGDASATLREDFTYTKTGEEQSGTRYSNLAGTSKVGVATYTYDSSGRVTNIQQQNASSTVIQNLTYTYDKADRATSETFNGTTSSYTYNADSELLSDSVATYSYDQDGNRTMAGYTTGVDNELTNDGTWTYTYNADGNLTEKSKGASAETWTYGYNNLNEMIWAQDRATPGGTLLSVATYTYDVFGHLISEDQTVGATTTMTRHAYDGNTIWADLSSSNALVMRYIDGNGVDQLLARESGSGTVNWFETDRLGSVTGIVGATGTPLDTITYDGYGNITSESSPTNGGAYKYASGQSDPETGDVDDDNRTYTAPTGRWTTPDPTGLTPDPDNPYRYVGDDPTNAIDPSGLAADRESSETAPDGIVRFVFENLDRPNQNNKLKADPAYLLSPDLSKYTCPVLPKWIGFAFLSLTARITERINYEDGKMGQSPDATHLAQIVAEAAYLNKLILKWRACCQDKADPKVIAELEAAALLAAKVQKWLKANGIRIAPVVGAVPLGEVVPITPRTVSAPDTSCPDVDWKHVGAIVSVGALTGALIVAAALDPEPISKTALVGASVVAVAALVDVAQPNQAMAGGGTSITPSPVPVGDIHGRVFANRDVAKEWETFKLIMLDSGKVAILSHKGYICAEGGGGSSVYGNRSEIGPWETWTMEVNDDGTVSFKSCHGYYLCAEGGGGGVCNANRTQLGPWECFNIERASTAGSIYLTTKETRQYVCVEN